jgi:hypothetical protein
MWSKKTPQKMENNNWFLLHDNAPAHRSVVVKDLQTKNNVTTLEHPPYSPDLPAADLYLSPQLKSGIEMRDGVFVKLMTLLRMRRRN